MNLRYKDGGRIEGPSKIIEKIAQTLAANVRLVGSVKRMKIFHVRNNNVERNIVLQRKGNEAR